MLSRRAALLVTALATWDAWRLLAARIDGAADAALIAAFVAGCAWPIARDTHGSLPAGRVAVLLIVYAAATIVGPALLEIGAATAALLLVASHGLALPVPPLLGTAFLVLPVLPTLDFLLAYPLRRISAAITVALLRLNGLDVSLQGVALAWHGRQLLFDGPCSGVRMLWAALLLASFAALVRGVGWTGYARLFFAAAALAVCANALRAASLFYLENGFVLALAGPWTHEAVGLLSLVLLAPLIVRLGGGMGRTA